ncbi:hypothetical protein V5O48_015975 [Marasmius crinis-equi]|uniref:Pre-mRNA-splicing factor SYF2 n=1 Tax=Marasmius crinis-equi TaxID=585013 RepID=A0ABR3ET28_9AGAR
MARKRAEMTSEDRLSYLEKQRSYSKKYYESNRNSILDKADAKRYREYETSYGRESFNRHYKFRDVKPREMLDLQKGTPAYEAAVEQWKKQKMERIESWKKAQE